MKKIIVFIVLFYFNLSFCQRPDISKEEYRSLFNNFMNKSILEANGKLTFFSKEDNLCIDLEEELNITYSDYLEADAHYILKEKSKESVVVFIKSLNDKRILNNLKNSCLYKNILVSIFYITKDYKTIKFKYIVDINNFISISDNFNREDALRIILNYSG